MGLTKIRAQQISNIDYKQAVRVIATTNVTLSGSAPSLVDGVSLLTGDRILVNGQSTGSQNGIYRVQTLGTGSNGTWIRTTDADQNGEIQAGMIVMVTEGELYADTQWKLITNDPIVVGITVLSFVINTSSTVGGNNTEIQFNNAGVLAGSANLAWLGGELSIGANIIPQANITYDLGNSTNRWNDIWLSNSTIYLGNAQISANSTSLIFSNPQGAQTVFSGDTSDITANTVTATGNISCANLTATGTVTAANIDSVNADLAEKYQSDQTYEPGTVVVFGGDQEITQSMRYADSRIAGVISTAPAYSMNSGSSGLAVALQGRTPCRVMGVLRKGDLVTSSNTAGVATRLRPQDWIPGAVIGKALQDHHSNEIGMIEVVVGRL
jgi:hypothetical protein